MELARKDYESLKDVCKIAAGKATSAAIVRAGETIHLGFYLPYDPSVHMAVEIHEKEVPGFQWTLLNIWLNLFEGKINVVFHVNPYSGNPELNLYRQVGRTLLRFQFECRDFAKKASAELLKNTDFEPVYLPLDPRGSMQCTLDSIRSSNLCKEIVLPTASYKASHTQEVPTHLSKEKSMSKAIINLADSNLSKELEQFGLLQPDVQAALAEAQAEARKTSAKAAATEIMHLLKTHDTLVEHHVQEIRRARQMEKDAKEAIAKLNKARDYGLATSNFVPLGLETSQIWASDLTQDQQHLKQIDESKIQAKAEPESGKTAGQ